MDNKGKLVIVVLVVLGVLFALGLGTNLVPKQGEDQEPANYGSDWLRTMDRLMGRFSPRLDGSRLQPGSGCKRKDGGYEFTSDTECNITITGLPEDADDDYQTATLRVSSAATVNVPCPDKQATAVARGTATFTRLKVKPGVLMQPAPVVVADVGAATLTVVYTPAGESPGSPECPTKDPKDEVRLVARKTGGSLTFQCHGCSASRVVQVDFKK